MGDFWCQLEKPIYYKRRPDAELTLRVAMADTDSAEVNSRSPTWRERSRNFKARFPSFIKDLESDGVRVIPSVTFYAEKQQFFGVLVNRRTLIVEKAKWKWMIETDPATGQTSAIERMDFAGSPNHRFDRDDSSADAEEIERFVALYESYLKTGRAWDLKFNESA